MNIATREDVVTEVVTEVAATNSPAGTAPVYRIELQPRPHVSFDESVVDNEHLGRRRSNKCCIFHKKRDFDESSSDSSDSDDSQSESEAHQHSRDCKQKRWLNPKKTKKSASLPSSSSKEEMSTPEKPPSSRHSNTVEPCKGIKK
ncbi:Uncharacterized conserved protein [Plasmopara halstedii]|uniref:Uncharacterized conserved protein n=1 Tax=Plasmopara halstedii TaxID=4781 RepID=A0A0P1A801_PLAHL|nr:Uncharacterized conserved protein [Plasmopara halstedii]CEG36314.1 Uncharacterized conserved protein [Plasmopara halstedii]|eukprot:XP_024572683.1 Uncharacterized conserved protein [Plasmopara halstedii]